MASVTIDKESNVVVRQGNKEMLKFKLDTTTFDLSAFDNHPLNTGFDISFSNKYNLSFNFSDNTIDIEYDGLMFGETYPMSSFIQADPYRYVFDVYGFCGAIHTKLLNNYFIL